MKITQYERSEVMNRREMICDKCREVKLPRDGDLSNLIHLDVPRSKGGGKETHVKKSDWNKAIGGNDLGNLVLICERCEYDLQVKKVSVRMTREKVQKIDDWRKKMLPNETLSEVFRIAVEKLIDETYDVVMKNQMVETKIEMMAQKIQMMEQIIHLPLDDIKRVDMLISDEEGKIIPVEVKSFTENKRGGGI